jgi:hypothetical protein
MSVRGALSTMPAEDVLEWVARRKFSGPITFERKSGGLVRSLVIDDGNVVWASSNRREEQLGVILVRSGFVADRALAESLETRAETGVPLGKVLIMAGLITEADLVSILATKIRETVTDIATWNEGTFDAVPRGQSPATGVNAQLTIEICLTIAERRRTRMNDIMSLLGSDDVTFYIAPNIAQPPSEDVHPIDLAKAWGLAGDRHSAAEIAAAFSGERYATFDALARMVEDGQLTVDRRVRSRTNSAVELAAGARGRLRQGDRAGAFAMASQALHQDPNDGEVRKTYAAIERARVAEVARQLLSRHRVPKRLREIGNDGEALGLTRGEIDLAARVDGRWDLLSLIRSASVREAEALLAFAHLAEVGVVDLG